jgi:hypothetical protein
MAEARLQLRFATSLPLRYEFVNALKEVGVFRAIINEPPPGSVRK